MNSIYQFEIDANGCNYELWLNDIRVDIQMSDHSIVYSLPVNQWIKKGKNCVEVSLVPLSNETKLSTKSYFKLKIVEAELNKGKADHPKVIVSWSSSDFPTLTNNPLQGIKFPTYFEASITFDNMLFQSLEKLDLGFREVSSVYKKVHALFATKDLKGLLQLMDFKITEFSKSYYDSYEDEVQRQTFFIEDLFSKNLQPLEFKNYKIKYFMDQKIVCIEDKEGDQPIFFTDDIDQDYTFYPFYFGRIKSSNGLIIAN